MSRLPFKSSDDERLLADFQHSERPPVRASRPLLLIGLGLLAYAPAFHGAFVLDDAALETDARIRRLWPLDEFLVDGRPVVLYSLAVNYAIGELDPFGYHMVNVGIHLMTGLLLYDLVQRLLRLPRLDGLVEDTRVGWTACGVAAIWLVHPLCTQGVTYTIQRYESAAAMFMLLTLNAVVRSVSGPRHITWTVVAVLASWCAFLSKQNAAVLPAVALAFDRAFLAGSWSEVIRRRWQVYALLCTPFFWFVPWFVRQNASPGATMGFALQTTTPLEYLASQPGVILHYLRLSIWPIPQVLDYGWPVERDPWQIAWTGGLVGGAVLWSTVAMIRGSITGCLVWTFFALLAPTSSIVPIADLAFEHRMYLPLACVVTLAWFGVRACCLWLDARLSATGRTGTRLGMIAFGGAVVVLASATWSRNEHYAHPLVIYRGDVVANPYNPRSRYNLGTSLLDVGRPGLAFEQLDIAIRLDAWPGREVLLWSTVAKALMQLERDEEAQAYLERALERDPDFAPANNDIGTLHFRAGRYEDALHHFDVAVGHSNHPEAGYNAALALRELGRDDEAVNRLRRFVAEHPDLEVASRRLEAWLAEDES